AAKAAPPRSEQPGRDARRQPAGRRRPLRLRRRGRGRALAPRPLLAAAPARPRRRRARGRRAGGRARGPRAGSGGGCAAERRAPPADARRPGGGPGEAAGPGGGPENAALAAQGGEARSEASELAAARQRLEREAQRARRQVEETSPTSARSSWRACVPQRRARGAGARGCRRRRARTGPGTHQGRGGPAHGRECAGAVPPEGAVRRGRRAAAAMREVSRLEASGAATRAEAARAAEEAAQGQQRAALLEASLGEVLERQRATASREREATQRLASVRSERDELLAAEEATRSELVDSERHAEETERKAHGVARELVETTEAISRLRAEATAQPLLQQELEEALREEGALEHRLEARWREARQGPEAAASPRLRGASAASAAEQELRRLRSSQERAENEALREAWEAASRERRETEAKLAALQADWLPLREVLVRLTTGAHRWRGGLFAVGEAGKRTDGALRSGAATARGVGLELRRGPAGGGPGSLRFPRGDVRREHARLGGEK
ncbi:unnamed protein product, partial [Prorocentrum cordatum]